ncbi:diaminobutyrate acetyltransferase [Paenibacillus thermotolerans]|uniref:diaminobutyrate acetyltransferase n=1 Tax=Paenibacillus thermotolerans TaxID=3027807 RepID=UPI0023678013|nr:MULTISPECIES: diaminobutyrate acetyltransferase [unclassified Paenibacillus]
MADEKPALTIRKPNKTDGGRIWEIVRNSEKLDVNSPYSYLLLGKYFHDTCAVAEFDGEPVGFVTGFRHPARKDTWFVWQIAVEEQARGRGVGRALLEHVLNRPEHADIRYIETTISPSNAASQQLFLRLARERKAVCEITECFTSQLFPEGAHEDEMLFQIGPMR